MNKLNFIGIETEYETADGQSLRRVHMDSAASPLAAKIALETYQKILPHYSNTHSYVHSSAHISTKALAWAHKVTLDFVGANAFDYTAIYKGSGSTAAINRVARGLSKLRPNKKIVLVSAMEHHANDLPHRQNGNKVIYIPLTGEGVSQGSIDLDKLKSLLQEYEGQVNYIAVSMVSNVTGIINPVDKIAKLAHQFDVLLVVDGAQAVAHLPIKLSQKNPQSEVDFFIFSGHKLYAPGSPGVLIAKKSILNEMPDQDLGGGSVADVSYYDYQLVSEFPGREQSGTPNIIGAIALASVMKELMATGLNKIHSHNDGLLSELILSLSTLDNIVVYGAKDTKRVGAVAFNHRHIDHGLLAALLNDYYGIAVRNECFCAHPYVSSLIKESMWELDIEAVPQEQQQEYINRKRGMVRASIGLYNCKEDVDYLIKSLQDISEKIEKLSAHYDALPDGSYQHKTFLVNWEKYLDI